MSQRVVEKSLAGRQDILFGNGQVTQTRAGGSYPINKVSVAWACANFEELLTLDTDQFKEATVNNQGAVTHWGWTGSHWYCQETDLTLIGSFNAGFTYTTANQVGCTASDIYSWSGSLPRIVAPGTDPATIGSGYVPRTDAVLRDELGHFSPRFSSSELPSSGVAVGISVEITDRGNSTFIIVSGGTPNGFDILDAGGGNTALLTGSATPESFGIVADWNGVTGTDNYPAYVAFDSYCASNGLHQKWRAGEYYFNAMELPASVDIKGTKGVVFVFNPSSVLKNCMVLSDDVTVKRITFRPSVTNSVRDYFENTFVADFAYHDKFMGPRVSSDCMLIDVESLGANRGVTAASGSSRISIIRGKYQGSNWGTSIYNCSEITMDGVMVHGGTEGGMAMPSCKRVNVVGGFVYNPDGTGVNTGGSPSAGFNTEYVSVVGVQIFARDCVNLENGCEHATISGNICNVLSQSASNGVGVGVHTRAGGGPVGDIAISNNTINSSYGTYSTAIKVGDAGAGYDSYGICIGPNSATKCRQGILFENHNAGKKNFDFEISGGSYNCYDRGLSLIGTHSDGSISGGMYSRNSTTTVSSTYGMELGALTKVIIDGVTTKGWTPHIRQQGVPVSSKITGHTFLTGDDNVGYTKLDNQSGGAAIQILESSPIPNISSAPIGVGQSAIVGGVGYIAVGTSSAADWKQVTN